MSWQTADVVICGAGIAGITAAYFLTVRFGVQKVILIDERPPLTLTSDKSTEAYRNWWPGPGTAMVDLMNRSIDLLETLAHEWDNAFHLNRRGYVYLASSPVGGATLQRRAREIASLGAGPLREHPGPVPYQPHHAEGFTDQPAGADLLLGRETVQTHFPYLAEDITVALHVRRCGWLSAQQLGMLSLQHARAAGAHFLSGRVRTVQLSGGRVAAVQVNDSWIHTPCFVNAAGPFLTEVGRLMGVDLPVFNELHGKLAFNDHQFIIPRDAPMMIWDEPLALPWTSTEREELAAYTDTHWLLDDLPGGLHFRPEGGPDSPIVLMLWPYHTERHEPVWPPPPLDEFFPDLVLRGLSCMVPGLAHYIGRAGKPTIDRGYYCKTRENRPLIGPLPVAGAYVFGALSGYGIMAAPAGAELLAMQITGHSPPAYAPAFHLDRYDEPVYQALLAEWGESGQL